MILSKINDGNMHPNLPVTEGSAQQNFENFVIANNLILDTLTGLRIDPIWTDGHRLVSNLPTNIVNGSVACEDRVPAHGVISSRENGLFVLSGDCFPLSIVAKRKHALLHLGWRSVDENLIRSTLLAMKNMGEVITDCNIVVGPGLGRESNIIPIENAQQLSGVNNNFWLPFINFDINKSVKVDLRGAIIHQLVQMGLSHNKIEIDDRDTFTDPELFSKRSYSTNASNKPRGNHVAILPAS